MTPQKLKACAFEAVMKKNTLRKGAGLPLLNVHEAIESEVRAAIARRYAASLVEHSSMFWAIRHQVLAEWRQRKGSTFGLSAGGRLMIDILPRQRFDTYLKDIGVRAPISAIRYGEEKAGT